MSDDRERCPLCGESLEVRDVAPCMECGADPRELEDLREGVHSYAVYRIFRKFDVVLCNFCQADFSSYDPQFFGLPRGRRVGLGHDFEFVRDHPDLAVRKDKACPTCHFRLPFLKFVKDARNHHSTNP